LNNTGKGVPRKTGDPKSDETLTRGGGQAGKSIEGHTLKYNERETNHTTTYKQKTSPPRPTHDFGGRYLTKFREGEDAVGKNRGTCRIWQNTDGKSRLKHRNDLTGP